jgi:hypothetical protein
LNLFSSALLILGLNKIDGIRNNIAVKDFPSKANASRKKEHRQYP